MHDNTSIDVDYIAVQSQKAVSAYFTSKQIRPFGFADQYSNNSVILLAPT